MTSELLPEWLNLFLDDFESSLCFPILILIVLCTAQLVYNQLYDIGFTFYQTLNQESGGEGNGPPLEIVQRIKGMLGIENLGCPPSCTAAKFAPNPEINSREEEWDYCDEEYD